MTTERDLTDMPLGVASPADRVALAAAAAGDGHLYRWPGGFWRTRPWTAEAPAESEPWHGAATIHRLLRQGRVYVVQRLPRGQPQIVALARPPEEGRDDDRR